MSSRTHNLEIHATNPRPPPEQTARTAYLQMKDLFEYHKSEITGELDGQGWASLLVTAW